MGENDPDLQRALLLSLGGNSAEAADDDAELERAIALSCTLGLKDAPDEVRKLLRTVATNLRRTFEAPNCDPAELAKFRQLNDEAVRKRTSTSENPDESYSIA